MRNRLAIGAVLAVIALAGCGGGSSSGDAGSSPTALKAIDPTVLLDKMEAAMAAKPTYHLQLRQEGAVLFEGDFDIGPPIRMSAITGPPDNSELVFVADTGYARPLKPKNAKWIKIPADAAKQIAADGDLQSMFVPLRAGTISVERTGSTVVDGENLEIYEWVADFKKGLRAAGDPIPEGAPERVTYRILVDDESLMREIEVLGVTVTASRWGEPLDIKLPSKSQIE